MTILFEQDEFKPLANAGKHVHCQRCGAECKVAATANQAARLGRRADGAGYCPDCVITQFLQEEIDVERILPHGVSVAEALKAPHIQDSFKFLLAAGHADMNASEINWERVIQQWSLPFKGRARRKSR